MMRMMLKMCTWTNTWGGKRIIKIHHVFLFLSELYKKPDVSVTSWQQIVCLKS